MKQYSFLQEEYDLNRSIHKDAREIISRIIDKYPTSIDLAKRLFEIAQSRNGSDCDKILKYANILNKPMTTKQYGNYLTNLIGKPNTFGVHFGKSFFMSLIPMLIGGAAGTYSAYGLGLDNRAMVGLGLTGALIGNRLSAKKSHEQFIKDWNKELSDYYSDRNKMDVEDILMDN